MDTPNLRTATYSTSKPIDVKDTKMLSGMAQEISADWNATNETVEDKVQGPPKNNLGGENSFM